MSGYTQVDVDAALEKIEKMDHIAMCKIWRFALPGTEIFFRSDMLTGEAFKKRLFEHFGGFTPEISQQIGFN